MFGSPEDVLWTTATLAPFGLVMLGGGVYLLARRTAVGWPAAVAGAVLVGLFAFNVLRFVLVEAAAGVVNAGRGGRFGHAELRLVLHAANVLGGLLHGAGTLAVAGCVLRAQRAA